MAKQKWWYRYKINWVSFRILRRKSNDIKVGSILLEKRSMGKKYTWQIYNFKTGKLHPAWSGDFIGKVPVDIYGPLKKDNAE
jgi:hypothetical protein